MKFAHVEGEQTTRITITMVSNYLHSTGMILKKYCTPSP